MQKRKFSTSVLILTNFIHFRLIARIIQVGLFGVSVLSLVNTTVVVAAGWAKTCATLKETSFSCTGPQYNGGPYPPNGAEFIAAAVSH